MEKKDKTMAEVSKNFEQFIKGKKTNKNNKPLFEKALKKAVKQRGSK